MIIFKKINYLKKSYTKYKFIKKIKQMLKKAYFNKIKTYKNF